MDVIALEYILFWQAVLGGCLTLFFGLNIIFEAGVFANKKYFFSDFIFYLLDINNYFVVIESLKLIFL